MRKIPILVGLLGLVLAQPALAERFHVRAGGTRTAGASVPDDWTVGNCYATLAGAAAPAAATDTLLLYRETHVVETVVTLAAHLGNQDLDGVPTGCEVRLLANGELVFDAASGAAEVAGVRFASDGVARAGSALYLDNSSGLLQTVTIRDSEFADLRGGHEPRGGAALHAVSGGGLTLSVLRCSFQGNVAAGKGGAVRIDDGYAAFVEDCVFTGNAAIAGSAVVPVGGALAVISPLAASRLEVRRTVFSDNISYQSGGAIGIENASLVLENCEVRGSRSAFDGSSPWAAGAGVMMRRIGESHVDPVELVIRSCLFQDNVGNLAAGSGAGDGGGVLVRGIAGRPIAVTVEHSDFLDNFNDQGAGLYIGRYATGTVSYCRFHGNTSFANGGAVFKGGALVDNLGETAVYVFCEFVGNRAGYDLLGQATPIRSRGGVFATRESPRAEFYHCTFADNVVGGTAAFGGDAIGLSSEAGDFDSDLERCVLVNCVFWGEGGNDIQVRSDPLGFSRVENCAWVDGQYVCDGVVPVSPALLTALPFTSAVDLVPFAGSPLVDAGFALGYSPDLAGEAVPQGGGPDIGAYEYPHPVGVPASPAETLSLSAAPNPFNPRTVLSCELRAAGTVQVDILDVRGQRVRRLFAGHREAGPQRWIWDGCDDRGRPLPGGVYLARVAADTGSAVGKLVLVK